jgi:hypothetical protein
VETVRRPGARRLLDRGCVVHCAADAIGMHPPA